MRQSVHPGPTAPSQPSDAIPVWRTVAWRTAVVLGLIGLVKPAAGVVARAAHADLGTRVPLAIMLAVSLVWIVVVAARRRTPAVPTLVAAGLVQAAGSLVLAWLATWALHTGAMRVGVVVGTLATGAVWGLVCGAVALALQNAHLGLRPPSGDPSAPTE